MIHRESVTRRRSRETHVKGPEDQVEGVVVAEPGGHVVSKGLQ